MRPWSRLVAKSQRAVTGSFGQFSSKITSPNQSNFENLNPPKEVSPRLQALRERLRDEQSLINKPSAVFQLSGRGQSFLDEVNSEQLNKKYSRGGNHG
jgi:hypothetical protein